MVHMPTIVLLSPSRSEGAGPTMSPPFFRRLYVQQLEEPFHHPRGVNGCGYPDNRRNRPAGGLRYVMSGQAREAAIEAGDLHGNTEFSRAAGEGQALAANGRQPQWGGKSPRALFCFSRFTNAWVMSTLGVRVWRKGCSWRNAEWGG